MKNTNPYLRNRKDSYLDDRHESLTHQSFKDECNIHNIIHQYNKTGLTTHLAKGQPQDVDHTLLPTYQEAMDKVTEVTQHFDQLPKEVKDKFKTTEALADFLSDPDNLPEAQKLGLIAQEDPQMSNHTKKSKGEPDSTLNESREGSLDQNSNQSTNNTNNETTKNA